MPSRRCVSSFAGPDVTPFVNWADRAAPCGWMAFDRWLFAVSPAHGTGVWDVATGVRLHHGPHWAPLAYHRSCGQFLTLQIDGTLRLSWLEGEA